MKFITFLFIACWCAACNDSGTAKKESTTNENKSPSVETTTGNNSISYKVNDQLINTDALPVTRLLLANKQMLNIVTDREKQQQTINISVNGITAGVYPFADGMTAMQSNGMSYGSFTPDAKNDMLNVYSFTEGTVELQSVDTVSNIVTATFSGLAKNSKGEVVKITEGKISQAKMSPGIIR